jgi:aromatic ring-opening dioxygenase LigB subunit
MVKRALNRAVIPCALSFGAIIPFQFFQIQYLNRVSESAYSITLYDMLIRIARVAILPCLVIFLICVGGNMVKKALKRAKIPFVLSFGAMIPIQIFWILHLNRVSEFAHSMTLYGILIRTANALILPCLVIFLICVFIEHKSKVT